MALPCVACKYDLEGLPDGVCPECGAVFSAKDFAAREEALEQVRRERKRAVRTFFQVAPPLFFIAMALLLTPSIEKVLLSALVVPWVPWWIRKQVQGGMMASFRWPRRVVVAVVLAACCTLMSANIVTNLCWAAMLLACCWGLRERGLAHPVVLAGVLLPANVFAGVIAASARPLARAGFIGTPHDWWHVPRTRIILVDEALRLQAWLAVVSVVVLAISIAWQARAKQTQA